MNSVRTILLIFAFCILSRIAHAQDFGRYWCFGDSAGVDFSDPSTPAPFTTFMDCSEGCSSVGDSSGLLMYAHTDYFPLWAQGYRRSTVIHNKYDDIVKNGDSLIADAFQNGLCFLPVPDNDSLFYLIQWGFYSSGDSGLFYSIVNPYYNNDSGIIVAKNIPLPVTDKKLQSGISAVRHGNGRDWWIIARNGYNSNRLYTFLVSAAGITSMPDQMIGTVSNTDAGLLEVSKTGNKIALVNLSGLIEVYDFDRCTGLLSNPRTIYNHSSIVTRFLDCAFSNNERYLYVSNTNTSSSNARIELFQLDLNNVSPFTNRTVLFSDSIRVQGGCLRLAPDNKIYWSCIYGSGWMYPDTVRNMYNENLSVINNPDSFGLACNFSPFSFYLGGGRTYWNLPNNVFYTLKQSGGSLCDSLYISTEELEKSQSLIYPNPTSGILNLSTLKYSNTLLCLYSTNLKLLRQYVHTGYTSTIDLSDFKDGIYYLRINESEIRKIVLIR